VRRLQEANKDYDQALSIQKQFKQLIADLEGKGK
jgi:hypothetical protein